MASPVILYVDDERTNCIVFEQSLQSEFPIRTCTDGASALTFLDQNDVAVLVTDMRMPQMNGEQLLHIVKEKYPRIIRIVLTAFSDTEPMLRALNARLVARYIVKPWQHEEMVQVLRWGVEAFAFGGDGGEVQHRILETERLATVGQFASMFVHDLRAPLTSALLNVNGHQELFVPDMRKLLEQGKIDEAIELLADFEKTNQEVERALVTLRDFLKAMNEFGKPRTDGTPPDTDPLLIVRRAMSVCSSLAMKSHAQLDYRGPATLPHVRIAPTDLTQVLINLLANGAQAIAARGVPIGYVSIEADARVDEVELRVRDEGVGMAPEVLNRIGTPFFTTRTEGTGLGFAQCQRLIGGAGGRLQVKSELGVGTTITIVLPAA